MGELISYFLTSLLHTFTPRYPSKNILQKNTEYFPPDVSIWSNYLRIFTGYLFIIFFFLNFFFFSFLKTGGIFRIS